MVNPENLKPPLKWAGGKRWLVPILQDIWQDYKDDYQLIEPFCGGLAIALGLAPQKAILNDVNPHLINFYRWLKKGLICKIEMANNEDIYYKNRDRFNELISTKKWRNKEAAALFYYLNRTGFNGLCRFNQKGGFNVPFGSYKKINYRQDFTNYQCTFKHWQFTLGDFEKITIGKQSFIYADPPYDVDFRQYSAGGFSWEDQVRLAKWLQQQTQPVVASNQATERIIELYRNLGFTTRTLKAPRRISCNGDRTPAMEMLALKNIEK
ncbi:DNA adenine methylase [[Limnothrix rosea] IAM M-220]|uniref:DNA adenine methylase n=1 Tax=[Limnothrix rosea] IAM M-220 TaxID=454133 RepID=UPI0009657C7C|nr:Dam family site-specific DNA-(adenine-N6)-methyltransferase [[Limnothrix rosea] IAM M-220]OKH11067.1 adenine methyltransferase [[Limnothrix rosea] IAM M-220]